MAIDNPILAYDFDMAVNLFGRIIENRLDQKVEVKNGKGQVIGHKPKYTIEQALGLNKSKKSHINTTEDAIAAGFILTKPKSKKKDKSAA